MSRFAENINEAFSSQHLSQMKEEERKLYVVYCDSFMELCRFRPEDSIELEKLRLDEQIHLKAVKDLEIKEKEISCDKEYVYSHGSKGSSRHSRASKASSSSLQKRLETVTELARLRAEMEHVDSIAEAQALVVKREKMRDSSCKCST